MKFFAVCLVKCNFIFFSSKYLNLKQDQKCDRGDREIPKQDYDHYSATRQHEMSPHLPPQVHFWKILPAL